MELGNQKVFHNLLIITQLDNVDTLCLLFTRGRGERLWTTLKNFFVLHSPPSKGGPTTDPYTPSERLILSLQNDLYLI
jgi:hypothetical protein